jgi:DNA-binding NtrC family response regulator
MSNLLVVKGPNVGVRYPLGAQSFIGRGVENTIQVLDPNVSRQHCEIAQRGLSHEVRDLESRNGVLVNGKIVTRHTLLHNDELAIGSTVFLYDPDEDLKDTRFSNKRVHFSSPTDETIVRVQGGAAPHEPTPHPRSTKDRELLCRLGEVFSASSLPLPQVLEKILQSLLGIFRGPRGCILTWDAVLRSFVPLVTIADTETFEVSQNAIRSILEEKQAVLLAGASSSDGGAAVLAVPMLQDGQVRGLLYLEVSHGDDVLLHDVRLLQAVGTLTQLAIEHSQTLDALETEKARASRTEPELLGRAPAFQRVMTLVQKVAATPSTVLITGETGTGKEMIAREIHRLSGRSHYPFMAINCAAIPDSLIESELFGHERGAFTGADRLRRGLIETAHGGTLFLDEVGEMNVSAQTKLLRFLQDRVITRVGGRQSIEVELRVIAATNADLTLAVREKRFREDLWFRLNVFEIDLPPLRERREDILLLAEHFLRHYARQYNQPALAMADDTVALLETYRWPGNVRELQNAVERAILLCDGDTIEPRHFNVAFNSSASPHDATGGGLRAGPARPTVTMAEAERRAIRDALASCEWNQVQAAQILQIHRNTLHKKMLEYGLHTPR